MCMHILYLLSLNYLHVHRCTISRPVCWSLCTSVGQKCVSVKVSLSLSSLKSQLHSDWFCVLQCKLIVWISESAHTQCKGICLNLFFCLPVQAGIPDTVLLYLSHLPVWLGQVPLSHFLQMVHSSRLHAQSGSALCGDRAQAADPPALCGPQPHSHSTGLGEGRSRGWQQEITANVELLQLQTQKQWNASKAETQRQYTDLQCHQVTLACNKVNSAILSLYNHDCSTL